MPVVIDFLMLVISRKKTKNSEVKLGKSRKYQYVKMERKRYFCLQQNPFVLAWIIFFRKNTLHPMSFGHGLRKWSLRWIKNEIWKYYFSSRSNFVKLIIFLKYKYHFLDIDIDSVVELPIYGEICVTVHNGFKIFNLYRGTVIKLFNPVVNKSAIVNEVEYLRNVSEIDFAPTIKRWDFGERWYEEGYISGFLDYSPKPRESTLLLDKFYRDIVPCLESLVSYKPTIRKKVIEHSNNVLELFKVYELLSQKTDIQKINKIENFINAIIERFHSEGDISSFLVFSHGDFCPANMLNTRRQVKVVDWESAGYRSILFDFYSYFFFRPVHQGLPVEELVSEISEALPFYISRLSLKNPNLSEHLLSFEKIYRWLYYVERISMLVERERTDTKLDIMRCLLGFIDAFGQYEELLSGKDD